MTVFIGTEEDDFANAALGLLSAGFTGGTEVELGDGLGDTFVCGGGEDFVFAANADDTIGGGEGHDVLNGSDGTDFIYGHTETDPGGSLIGDEIVGNMALEVNRALVGEELVGNDGSDKLFGSGGDPSAAEASVEDAG